MISVIIPTYNRAEYLAESLNSVLRQTYKDIEIIVVDDGSTDSTPILMDYFTKLDKRIKYIKKPENEGIARTRNMGLSQAKGEYIAVHDSDDFMLPKKLSKSLKKLQSTNADLVYTSYYMADANGRAFGTHEPPDKVTAESVHKNDAYPHITILAKRECFTKHPYRDVPVNDDTFLVLDWFIAGYKAVKIKEPLSIVRYHDSRISLKKVQEIERINEQMRQELKAHTKD